MFKLNLRSNFYNFFNKKEKSMLKSIYRFIISNSS